MNKTHSIFIIPGLGDETWKIECATRHWEKYGLKRIMYPMGWYDGEDFEPKLDRLVTRIKEQVMSGDTVSLVGLSAGGSAAGNAFIKRPEHIYRVVTVCSRLRKGTEEGYRSFEKRTASSPAFAQSVTLFESSSLGLTTEERQRFKTVRAKFGDELVPPETAILQGAYNIEIPTIEHILSIGLALTVYSKHLIGFLKGKEV